MHQISRTSKWKSYAPNPHFLQLHSPFFHTIYTYYHLSRWVSHNYLMNAEIKIKISMGAIEPQKFGKLLLFQLPSLWKGSPETERNLAALARTSGRMNLAGKKKKIPSQLHFPFGSLKKKNNTEQRARERESKKCWIC